jgi:hypothetical protein
MAAEFSANATQVVQINQPVIFTESPVARNRGLVFHRDESGIFLLANNAPSANTCSCGCRRIYETLYQVEFHGNISVPTDPAGTVEPISLAIAINGETDPSSIMTVTVPLVSDTFGDNVGASIIVAIPSICGCQSVSVRNISTQAINVMNANILFNYIGYRRVR